MFAQHHSEYMKRSVFRSEGDGVSKALKAAVQNEKKSLALFLSCVKTNTQIWGFFFVLVNINAQTVKKHIIKQTLAKCF